MCGFSARLSRELLAVFDCWAFIPEVRSSFIFFNTKAGFFFASLSFLNRYSGFSLSSNRRFVRLAERKICFSDRKILGTLYSYQRDRM